MADAHFPFALDRATDLTGTRLEEPLRRICIALDALHLAQIVKDSNGATLPPFSPDSYIKFNASIPNLMIVLPGFSALFCALEDRELSPLSIKFESKMAFPSVPGRSMSKVAHFYHDTIASQFVMFFEQHYAKAKMACNSNYENMENTWKFARRVRDAITHGDRFNINDKKFKSVFWRGYEIGRDKHGISLSSEIRGGDLIVLMFDMEHAVASNFKID